MRFLPVLFSFLRLALRPGQFQICICKSEDKTLANSRCPVSTQKPASDPYHINTRRRQDRLSIADSPDVFVTPHWNQQIPRLIGGRWSIFRLFSRLEAIPRRIR